MSEPTCGCGWGSCRNPGPVKYFDSKGYAYCANHGEQLVSAGRAGIRKLKPVEIESLDQGWTIRY